MKKTDKKRDNALRQHLTEACETALEKYDGFVWLTHVVDYARFPQSLKVVCVFATDQQLEAFFTAKQHHGCYQIINQALLKCQIRLPNPHQHVLFDSEQQCSAQHQGNWQARLK